MFNTKLTASSSLAAKGGIYGKHEPRPLLFYVFTATDPYRCPSSVMLTEFRVANRVQSVPQPFRTATAQY